MNCRIAIPKRLRGNRGVVLMFALGSILVFTMLGTAYVTSMGIALKETRYDVHRRQASGVAESGIHAAIAEIQAALRAGRVPQPDYRFAPNTHRQEYDGLADYPHLAAVTVVDESALVNINHAPAAVLTALGIPDEKAQAMEEARNSGRGSGLGAVGDLKFRSIVSPREWHELETAGALDTMTVHTVVNPAAPSGYINLNSAPPAVLAAVFGIEATEAERIANSRRTNPFDSWESVLRVVGREPHTFNMRPARIGSREMPEAFTLRSRSFRIYSETYVEFQGSSLRTMRAAVEAVVVFDERNQPHIRYWNELPGDLSGTAPVEVNEDNAPAS